MIKLLKLYEELNRIDTSKLDEKDRRFLEVNSYSNKEVVINGIEGLREMYNLKTANVLNFYDDTVNNTILFKILDVLNITFDKVYYRIGELFLYSTDKELLYSLRRNVFVLQTGYKYHNISNYLSDEGLPEYLGNLIDTILINNNIIDINVNMGVIHQPTYNSATHTFHVNFETKKVDEHSVYKLFGELYDIGDEFDALFKQFTNEPHYLTFYKSFDEYIISIGTKDTQTKPIEVAELE